MRKLWIALGLAVVLAGSALAGDILQEEAEILGADRLAEAVPADAEDALDGVSPLEQADFGRTVKKILSGVLQNAGRWARQAARSCAMLLAAALLGGAAQMSGGTAQTAARMASCLAMAAVCTSSLNGMIALAKDAIDTIGNFSALLLPVLSSALAASGGTSSGGALYAGSTLLISLLTSLIRSFFIPCVYCYLFLTTARYAIGDERLSPLQEGCGWVISAALKGTAGVFTAYLTLTGLLAGSADEMALKAAKGMISTAVPVVGSILSDASDAILTSAGLIKNAAGAFGLLAVLATGAAPFFHLAVQYLALRATAAIGGFVAQREQAGMLRGAATAMGQMLAMTGCAILMALVAICCFIKAVNG